MIDQKLTDKLIWIIDNSRLFKIELLDDVIEYDFYCQELPTTNEDIIIDYNVYKKNPLALKEHDRSEWLSCNDIPYMKEYLTKIIKELPNLKVKTAIYSTHYTFDTNKNEWEESHDRPFEGEWPFVD